jgi:hypothetical protein
LHHCYELTCLWPTQLQEISQNLFLIDDGIGCPTTRCSASKDLALFVLL